MSESNELTQFILTFFLDCGIYAKRHGVASGPAEYTNKKGDIKSRYIHAGITGGSDIFVWLPYYRFLGIEVKIGKDKLRPLQETFNKYIEKMGHLIMVVKTKEDFILRITPILNKLNIKIPEKYLCLTPK
jgi:hypothetical protein